MVERLEKQKRRDSRIKISNKDGIKPISKARKTNKRKARKTSFDKRKYIYQHIALANNKTQEEGLVESSFFS